ncbi:hypothetical protein COCON_G00071230 [Conger conger]|uniref:Uncharacterized protein n=1 Tax=Conger conger TaxID=82655 RepID=A0A9Q1DTC9_CONCO|nr:hypothetical protein COCON_G00071230 [Conger conger]
MHDEPAANQLLLGMQLIGGLAGGVWDSLPQAPQRPETHGYSSADQLKQLQAQILLEQQEQEEEEEEEQEEEEEVPPLPQEQQQEQEVPPPSPPLPPPPSFQELESSEQATPPPSTMQTASTFNYALLPQSPPPPVNALGLPKGNGTVSFTRKPKRVARIASDSEIQGSKDAVIQDLERKLRFKEERLSNGQQRLTYEEKMARRLLGPGSATVLQPPECV